MFKYFPYVVSKYLWFDIEIFVANFDVWARGNLSTSRRVEHLPSSPSTHRASGKQHKEGSNVYTGRISQLQLQ